ncbi:hypothetical protein [Limnobacter sp. UBA6514]|uniref:hypothetical protein n=1 Tax=Limnobacter sp. UBA6514 TaxID=1946761 RepID=UPI0025C2A9C7|nr:hypothetical protein [Limnobacter sp. UBA6514]
MKSLQGQPGLLAYSVRRQLFGNQAWTLTLWESENSKSAFIRSSAHQLAMAEASSVLSCARFLRVDWSGEVKNLDWDDVLDRLDTEAVSICQPRGNMTRLLPLNINHQVDGPTP